MYCPGCGKLNEEGARFCNACGMRLDGDGSESGNPKNDGTQTDGSSRHQGEQTESKTTFKEALSDINLTGLEPTGIDRKVMAKAVIAGIVAGFAILIIAAFILLFQRGII